MGLFWETVLTNCYNFFSKMGINIIFNQEIAENTKTNKKANRNNTNIQNAFRYLNLLYFMLFYDILYY